MPQGPPASPGEPGGPQAGPTGAAVPDAPLEAPPRTPLPDTKGALPIPDQFRLPFHGKMVTPTSVPSATQRRYNLVRLQRRRQRRGFLLGLLVGQIIIIAFDVGGELFLRTHPHIRIAESLRVSSIVFLGMAAGAVLMTAGVAAIYAFQALCALRGPSRSGSILRGLRRVFFTLCILAPTMGIILGTAWFMIPGESWKPTVDFARRKGAQGFKASSLRIRSLFGPSPRPE